MSYTIGLNTVFLVVGLIGLNVLVWRITSIDDLKNEAESKYYNWFLIAFGSLCIVSNSVQLYSCTHKVVDIFGAIIYTLLSWMCFIIVVVYREYLRIPIANVIGYLMYSRSIEHWVNCINGIIKNIKCADPENCPKDEERSIFEICTLLRSGKLFDLSIIYLWPQLNKLTGLNQGDSNESPISMESDGNLRITNTDLIQCISGLFITCYKRDLMGDIILFSLTGILCVFISEYILSTYKCLK